MRNVLVLATLLISAALPALADNPTATTQSPPSPHSGQSAPQSDNSLPANAETSNYGQAGDRIGETRLPSEPRQLSEACSPLR